MPVPVLSLTAREEAMLGGEYGEASALAMRIIVALAEAQGAERLIPVESAHIDGCLYHGRAGLDFARRLVETGGRVAVPTTCNVGSLDLLHPGLVRTDEAEQAAGRALMSAYTELGCRPTWSCAPYQAGHRPAVGTQIAWGESNAIVFANSVLGARTNRYGDFADIAAAITGVAPESDLHTDAGRRAALVVDCTEISAGLLAADSTWPALGAVLGETAGSQVAAITGLPGDLSDGRTEDRLKALGATAASAGSVALFHAVGITPEAPTLDAVLAEPADLVPTHRVTEDDIRRARRRLSTFTAGPLDAVSLGTPHFSVSEFAALAAQLADGEPFAETVQVWVCTNRAVLEEATGLGFVEPFLAAGGRVLTDTCTYLVPVIAADARRVMTNSGKWAWYAPGNLGVDAVLGSLSECVASARAGEVVLDG